MSKINEIIRDYTSGKTPVEETNAALKAEGAGYSLRPGQNTLTAEEIASAVGGPRPEDADGWGLLDTGTGSLDKVRVEHGVLTGGAINQVREDGTTTMTAYVTIGGHVWEVYGDQLGEVRREGEPWWAPMHTFADAMPWEQELPKYIPSWEMVHERAKYHGVEVVKGGLRYIYDEDGTCQYQPASMFQYDRDHGRA